MNYEQLAAEIAVMVNKAVAAAVAPLERRIAQLETAPAPVSPAPVVHVPEAPAPIINVQVPERKPPPPAEFTFNYDRQTGRIKGGRIVPE